MQACYVCLPIGFLLLVGVTSKSDSDGETPLQSPGQSKPRSSSSKSRSSSTSYLENSERWQAFGLYKDGKQPPRYWKRLKAESVDGSTSGLTSSLGRLLDRWKSPDYGRVLDRARYDMPMIVETFSWRNVRPTNPNSSIKIVFTDVRVRISDADKWPVYMHPFRIAIDYVMTELTSSVFIGYELQVLSETVTRFEPTPLTSDPKPEIPIVDGKVTSLFNPMWRRLRCLGFEPDSLAAAGTDGRTRTLRFVTTKLQRDLTPWTEQGLNSLELKVYEQRGDGDVVLVGGLELKLFIF